MDDKNIELLGGRECPNCCPCCIARKDVERANGSPTKFVVIHFKEYCSATSIHGVQYLGETGRPLSERFWWFIIFILSFLGNTYLIRQVWIKWNDTPVIVSFAETTTSLWEIPFPTVTFCPLTAYRNAEYKFQKPLYNISAYPEYQEEVEAISVMCSNPLVDIPNGNLTTDRDLIEFYRQIGVPFRQQILQFRWKLKDLMPYGDIFTEVATADGICYSFNILDFTELYRPTSFPTIQNNSRPIKGWNIEDGYLNDEKNNYPERTIDSGVFGGLEVIIAQNYSDFDHLCHGFTPGVKVILSTTGEIPSAREKFFIVEPDKNVFAGVKPDIIKTSKTLKSYKPSQRKCYFPSERYLSHFKLYTQENCDLECLTNYTIKECGCIAFYMPRSKGSKIPICGAGSKNCMENVKGIMHIKEKSVKNLGCDCLPSCASTSYNLDVTEHKFEWQPVFELEKIQMESVGESLTISKLTIYFTDKQYTTSQRSELYGLVDFLANCGGLIGLFSGFSVLSIVELVYFLTLRCWNNNRNKHSTLKNDMY